MAVIKFTTSNPYIDGQLTWSAVSNGPAANSSRVTIAVHLRRNNVGYVSYGTFNTHVTCNGARQDENGLYVTINENAWTLVYAKVFTVPHNSDGTKTCGITINGDSDFNLSFGAHFDVVLPKIPRYTSITAWAAVGVTDNSITFSWAAADNISNIVCQFNGVTKYSLSSLNTSRGSFTVNSLSEHTTYSNIKIIVTRKDSGLTTASEALSVTTNYIAPTANLTFQSNTINSIVLNWNSNFACDAIWIYNSGSQIYTAAGLNTASGSVVLSPSTWAAIAPGTSYSLSIKVRRKVSGAVAASSAISVRTLSLPSVSSDTPTAFNIGASITTRLVNYANNASSLAFQVYNGDWVTTDTVTAEKGTASKVITPNAPVLYAKCPDSNTLSCRIACSVTCNGKTYPSYYYLTANVTNSNPSFFGFTFQTNVNTNINSVIGGTTNMLTRTGNLKLQFAANCAAGLNSASVTSLEIKILHDNAVLANKTIPFTTAAFSHLYTDAFSTPGTYALQINALDSRDNRSNIISKSFSVYSYNKPALEITMNRQNEFEEKIYLNLKGEISKVTILNTQKNNIAGLKYRYAKSGDAYSDYIPLTGYTTASGSADNFIYTLNKQTDTNYFLKLDYEQSYTFQFLLTDKMFDSTVYEIFVPQGKPAFATFDNGYSVVDKIPQFSSSAKLQVGSDIMVQDSTGQDVLLLEQIKDAVKKLDSLNASFLNKTYPVGSIYMSVNSTNPASLFGGTWTAWGSGRVPVGMNTSDGNFNTVEKMGGSSYESLAVSQMPYHSHSIPANTAQSAGNHGHTTAALRVVDAFKISNAILGWKSKSYPGGTLTKAGTASRSSPGCEPFYIDIPNLSVNAAGTHTHYISASTTGANGSGGAHNNLQPYITCYMWKRTV